MGLHILALTAHYASADRWRTKTRCSSHILGWGTTTPSCHLSSSVICWKTPGGTPSTHPTRPRLPRAGAAAACTACLPGNAVTCRHMLRFCTLYCQVGFVVGGVNLTATTAVRLADEWLSPAVEPAQLHGFNFSSLHLLAQSHGHHHGMHSPPCMIPHACLAEISQTSASRPAKLSRRPEPLSWCSDPGRLPVVIQQLLSKDCLVA